MTFYRTIFSFIFHNFDISYDIFHEDVSFAYVLGHFQNAYSIIFKLNFIEDHLYAWKCILIDIYSKLFTTLNNI